MFYYPLPQSVSPPQCFLSLMPILFSLLSGRAMFPCSPVLIPFLQSPTFCVQRFSYLDSFLFQPCSSFTSLLLLTRFLSFLHLHASRIKKKETCILSDNASLPRIPKVRWLLNRTCPFYCNIVRKLCFFLGLACSVCHAVVFCVFPLTVLFSLCVSR